MRSGSTRPAFSSTMRSCPPKKGCVWKLTFRVSRAAEGVPSTSAGASAGVTWRKRASSLWRFTSGPLLHSPMQPVPQTSTAPPAAFARVCSSALSWSLPMA